MGIGSRRPNAYDYAPLTIALAAQDRDSFQETAIALRQFQSGYPPILRCANRLADWANFQKPFLDVYWKLHLDNLNSGSSTSMRAFYQHNPANDFPSINTFIAAEAYRQMGWEMVPFNQEMRFADLQPENVVVGYVTGVQAALHHLGVTVPPEPNYPEVLQGFLGRKIWRSTINTVANNPDQWNIFVKPLTASKAFTGRVVRSPKDLISCGNHRHDVDVWCSEIVEFVTEWRCFVRYGQILDVRHYAGDWRSQPDVAIIEAAVQQYQDAPAGYAIDFGLTRDGRTLLIEVNDGYAIGAYGLFYIDYGKLLSARWAEMTGTKDYCNF